MQTSMYHLGGLDFSYKRCFLNPAQFVVVEQVASQLLLMSFDAEAD